MKKIKFIFIVVIIISMILPSSAYAKNEDKNNFNPPDLYTPKIYEAKDYSQSRVTNRTMLFDNEIDLYFKMEQLIKEALINGDSKIDISNLGIDIYQYPKLSYIIFFSPYLNNDIKCDFYYFETTYVYCILSNSMTIKETQEYFKQVDIKVAEIKSCVSNGLSDEEIALSIHDYLCYFYEYDYDNYLNGTLPNESYKSNGLFMKGRGVCQAYAYGYQYIMGLFNIECYVTSSDEMNHAWNIVKIEGSYYHVDCTLDDPVRDRLGSINHNYFLLSDSAIMKGSSPHTGWDLTKLTCNNTKYDDAYWNNIQSQIILINNDRYYIKNSKLEKMNVLTRKTTQLFDLGVWPVWNDSGYWLSSFSGLFHNQGYLYFNTYDRIQRLSLVNNKIENVYKPNITNGYIYGIRDNGQQLQYILKKQYNDQSLNLVAPISLLVQPSAIILDKSSAVLNLGDSLQLKATVIPTDAPIALSWKVDREDILTVSDTGDVKAKSAGTATITVMTSNRKIASCQITVTEKPLPFTDVSSKVWYYNTVKETYKLGLMTGTTSTTFSPDSSMSRGMVATVLYRMASAPNVTYKSIFKDVNKSDYYAQAVTWAYNNKIISGYSNNKFGPNDNVTREQIAVMLCNYARFKNQKVNITKDLSKFKDYKNITSYATPSMMWVVKNGIMSGTEDGRLNPISNATRAECAKMLLQTYKLI